MKKFLALAIAIAMMAVLAVPAFAAYTQTDEAGNVVNGTDEHYGSGNDTPTTDPSNDNYLDDQGDYVNSDTTLVKYGVAQAYIVTIPAQIDLHENKTDSTNKTIGYVYGIESIGVSDVVVAGDEELNIYISSAQFADGKWTMKDTEGTKSSADVNYKIVVDPTDDTYAADNSNYILEADYDTTDGVISGDGTTLDGHVLNCEVADGNVGTTGSAAYANLYFSSKGTAQEGTYTDTLTFHVRIQAATTYVPAP